MFSKKATKIDKILTVDLTLCSKCQIDGEDFVNFCGLLRKYDLYNIDRIVMEIIRTKAICNCKFLHKIGTEFGLLRFEPSSSPGLISWSFKM